MQEYLTPPTIFLALFLIRLLITGASVGDALVMIALSAVYFGTYYFRSGHEEPVNKEIINRVVELEETLRVTKEKVNAINLGAHLKR